MLFQASFNCDKKYISEINIRGQEKNYKYIVEKKTCQTKHRVAFVQLLYKI